MDPKAENTYYLVLYKKKFADPILEPSPFQFFDLIEASSLLISLLSQDQSTLLTLLSSLSTLEFLPFFSYHSLTPNLAKLNPTLLLVLVP